VLVGEFPRTPGGRPKSKGFENPFQNNPTPCKNNKKPTPNSAAQSRMDLCRKSTRKNEKNVKNLKKKKWVSGRKMEKKEIPANGRPAVSGLVGEGPAMGRGVVGR
jgi:hypothetical protein